MQRLKKISISLCIAILLFNIVSPVLVTMAASNEPYNHKELLEYKGYGEAMYEAVVDETVFITGQYTDNKEYVSQTIDQIKDYAKFWGNEFSEFVKADSLRDAIERGGGLMLTIGDFFKKLFTDYGTEKEGLFNNTDNISYVDEFGTFYLKSGYRLYFTVKGKEYYATNFGPYHSAGDGYATKYIAGTYQGYIEKFIDGYSKSKMQQLVDGACGSITSISNVTACLNFFDVSTRLVYNGNDVPSKPENPAYRVIFDHIQSTPKPTLTPEPRAYLSCPNGTKIQMSISGSTFLGVDGKAMIVNKDGTAEVDSAICNLNWDKPTVKYIDGKTAIETPGRGYKDVETGEQIVPDKKPGDPDEEEEGEDGECGTLCALGKLTKFLLNFFEKLLDFFIKIFIPEDTDFLTNEFDKLKKVFDEKFKIVGSLEKTMSDFFVQENTNPLANLSINLPATGGQPIDVMPTTFVEQHVPTLKKVMSGFIVIMTIFYVYRKITGRGGVMEK
ncbi:hypothetical protein [Lysinibacillus sp. FSL K6-0102]|uniref:hypothetical protein n=1 Tax=Lysinibacillus sp. FSL K6-0102 TaxID=2975290 RepID=UPI0030FBCA17